MSDFIWDMSKEEQKIIDDCVKLFKGTSSYRCHFILKELRKALKKNAIVKD